MESIGLDISTVSGARVRVLMVRTRSLGTSELMKPHATGLALICISRLNWVQRRFGSSGDRTPGENERESFEKFLHLITIPVVATQGSIAWPSVNQPGCRSAYPLSPQFVPQEFRILIMSPTHPTAMMA